MSADSPADERFDRRDARNSRALLAAIHDLCEQTDRTLDDMEQATMREICGWAEAAYGADLPDFWRIWKDWNQPGQSQPMGEL